MPTWTKPVTLTANTNENVNDLNAILDDIYSRANGGLDETNVPNLAAAFTTYKRLERANGQISGQPTGTYLMNPHPFASGGTDPAPGASTAYPADFAIELDPAIYNANSRTTKLRLQLTAFTNAVAPAITFTVGLYPIATYGGASAAAPLIATLGAVVSGSTAAVASPAAAGRTPGVGADFNFPAAGAYVIAVAVSGASAANSLTQLVAQLEMRQV
jgi:hypothetical protein